MFAVKLHNMFLRKGFSYSRYELCGINTLEIYKVDFQNLNVLLIVFSSVLVREIGTKSSIVVNIVWVPSVLIQKNSTCITAAGSTI